ncbi:ornithine cyclodeaminase family protein [Saccharothrix deserti]|uniref:ornithine cyclodeaminase family protein n=1 Tax=Saccharothrix deserti TaxID=2593674 RepID=UPI00192E6569|nr:ornithine cyclodeaminase family protein [Saccharothrix deserti]
MDTLLITPVDVLAVIEHVGRTELMSRIITRLDQGLARSHAEGQELSPPRGGFVRQDPLPGVTEWMPHQDIGQSITIKTVSYSPANPRKFGLPTITGTVARFDDKTGTMVALADGIVLTALRTGAASAVASRILAHPESSTVGLIGAGTQAVTQLHALSLVLPIHRALVWDLDPGHSASFERRTDFLGIDVVQSDPRTILAESDVITTATTVGVGEGPVLPDGESRPHLHVNAVGSDLIGKTELPKPLLDRALVIPDHPAQALMEGECQQLSPGRIGPGLAVLCHDPGRFQDARETLTVFDSTGFALEDHLALDALIEAAVEIGAGTQVSLEYRPADPLDPYSQHVGSAASVERVVEGH